MQFGIKAGEETPQSADAGAGGSYIKYFKEKATTLRCLDEINEWTSVWMHFNNTKNRDYPCTDDFPTCPGHNSPNERERKPSKRYIVNALNVETGYVDLYKIPYSIKEDFDRNADKYGTITDRDYTVYKKQANGQTDYAVEREDRQELDLTPYIAEKKDHQEALANAFREVWGGLPGEPEYTGDDFIAANQDVPEEPVKKRSVYDRGDNEQKTWSETGSRVSVARPKEDDRPPTEPAVQQDEDQRELTIPQLQAMTEQQIVEVYEIAAVPVPASFKDKDELISTLVAALS